MAAAAAGNNRRPTICGHQQAHNWPNLHSTPTDQNTNTTSVTGERKIDERTTTKTLPVTYTPTSSIEILQLAPRSWHAEIPLPPPSGKSHRSQPSTGCIRPRPFGNRKRKQPRHELAVCLYTPLGVNVLANIDWPAIQFGVVQLVDGVRSVLFRGEPHCGTPLRAALSILRDFHKLHVPHLLEVVLSKVERKESLVDSAGASVEKTLQIPAVVRLALQGCNEKRQLSLQPNET